MVSFSRAPSGTDRLEPRRQLPAFVPLLTFAMISLFLVYKALFLPDCLAFDRNDDAAHTFPGLFVAFEIIAQGEVPLMNVYNNFGTPILGDAFTYPFAIQSVTYAFMPAPLAMTVNRVIIAIATMLALYGFFRATFGRFEAILVSIVSFFTPGFFWHFAHHHYQAALLIFVCFLLVFVKYGRGEIGARAMTFLVFALGLVFILSVSINLVAIAIPFLLGTNKNAAKISVAALRKDKKLL